MIYNNCINASGKDQARIVFGKSGQAAVNIYNVNGSLIKEYHKQYYEQGSVITWNGSYQNRNDIINSGIYIVHITGDINDKIVVIVKRD